MAALVMLPLAAFRPVARDVGGETPRLARVIRPTLVEYGPELVVPTDLTPKSTEKVVNTYRSDTDTTFELSAPVRSGGTLNLELKTGGDITIGGWDRPQVVVRAALGGRDWRLTHIT